MEIVICGHAEGYRAGRSAVEVEESYITDADGLLFWMNGGEGFWSGILPGAIVEVSFWLDSDNDGTIDTGAEADSNVPGWGTPWARWGFTAGL